MAEKKREKFGQRVYNACRALRGDPWPQVFEFANPPMMKAERPDIKTLFVGMSVHKLDAEQMSPDILRKVVTDKLSVHLAHTLATMGAVEIHRDDREACDPRAPFAQYIRYTGRLQVVMPEKEG